MTTSSIGGTMLAAVAFLFLCQRAQAERYTPTADPDSSEGQFLELINVQSDEAKRVALIEQFAQRYPAHQAVSWAYEQLQGAALQAGQWDRALTFGEKLARLHPDDMETAQLNVKAAESKGDKTSAKLWSDYMGRIAQRVLESPAPKDPDALAQWKRETAAAAQYFARGEYAAYKKALDAGDPRQTIKLLDDLFKQNPNSAYRSQAQVVYLNAYRALGDNGNGLQHAERILIDDPNNEDALLVAAEAYLRRGSDADKVLAYSARIIEVMNTKKKPAIVRQEDWEKKKVYYAGTAQWMMGNVFINQNRFAQADAALRSALPALRHDEKSAASILFYLGWANYRLENYAQAVRFYKQCGAIRSEFQAGAAKNLAVIREQQGIQ